MKLAQLVACLLFAVAMGCSPNPRSTPLPDDLKQAESDPKVQAAVQKLSPDDRELFSRYIKTRIAADDLASALAKHGAGGDRGPHAKTIGEAIETQKKWDDESKVAVAKNKATEAAYASLPKGQVAFCKAVNSFQDEYREAKAEKQNQLKLSQLRAERKQEIAQALSQNNDVGVVGWVGTITRLRTDGDGKASLQVTLSCEKPIKLSTGSHIPQTSPVYATLTNLDKGKKVAIAGRFFPSDQDALHELSLTEAGSMLEPDFRFEFSSVAAAP